MNAAANTVQAPRRRGLKRLIRPLVAPQVFDFWASRVNPLWSWERPLARLIERWRESSDAVTLVLQPNRHWTGFRPGQHINVAAEIDGARISRSYSLTGLPRGDGRVEITVKAIAGGKLSQYLCQQARIGEIFDIGPAFGELQLSAPPQGRWLFLAAGSGITPLTALTRQLAGQGMPVELTLIYWARTHEELCFAEELTALAAAQPRFRLHTVLTRETGDGAAQPGQRIGADLLQRLAGACDQQQVVACGPGGFVDTARQLLQDHALSFQAEAFTLPPLPVEDTGSVQVQLARSGRTLSLPRGQSLLTALEAEGLKPASGCRMGICNTCACGKASGVTRHLPSGGLDPEPSSALKLCINSATTDLVLDL
ncbi:ferredoxin reductase [Pseudoxanthomonas wuyuanensis]